MPHPTFLRLCIRLCTAGLTLALGAGGEARDHDEPQPSPPAAVQPTEPPPPGTTAERDPKLVLQERVTVVGTTEAAAEIPGAAQVLTGEPLRQRQQAYDDIHRVLRPMPGLNIQEEDGFGHRPNIGMRGSGTERSAKITLMEDGVLIAPAPYSAPAAYYFPFSGRMEAVEVRKGSSQIKYGPNTVGGALNLVSTSVPGSFRLRAKAEGGQHGSGKLYAHAGDGGERFGWLLESYQGTSDGFKQLDGGGGTGFRLQDYVGKLRFNSSRGARVYQHLELKLGATDERSDETYLGLTEEDFRATPLRRYAGSQLDVLDAEHRQLQLRHFAALRPRFDLTTTLWHNGFERAWYKLESVLGTSLASVLESPEAYPIQYAVLTGADSAENALVVRNNNRSYYSRGFQTQLGIAGGIAGTRHQLELGARYLEDEEDRFQQDDRYQMLGGRMSLTRAGAPGSQSNRVSSAGAWAFFLQDQMRVGHLTLVPGFRVEKVAFERVDYALTDPDRTAPMRVLSNDVDVLVPGIGAHYAVSASFGVVAGIHKGFAPPGPGADDATRPEESLNYELGLRGQRGSLRAELTGFYNDYDNLLGRDTLATGGSGSGDVYNGGKARVLGLEASVSGDLRGALGFSVSLPVRASYTFTDGEFRSDFQSQYEPWGTVAYGDELPYLPHHQLFSSIGAAGRRWLVDLSATYVSRMRTEAGQGPLVPLESTDSAFVLDLLGDVALASRVRAYLSVQNLLDRSYVVARQPAGVRPGLPRTLMVGVRLEIGG
jgi:Fe(3+) dicitrate transport protein